MNSAQLNCERQIANITLVQEPWVVNLKGNDLAIDIICLIISKFSLTYIFKNKEDQNRFKRTTGPKIYKQ